MMIDLNFSFSEENNIKQKKRSMQIHKTGFLVIIVKQDD